MKNDIEIHVPDFLSTVKTMVKDETFDTNKRWRLRIADPMYYVPERRIETELETQDKKRICEIIEKYDGMAGLIVPVLQDINSAFSYLPEPALRFISRELDMPLSKVFRIATFYNSFSLVPRGKNLIRVCMGTSCYVKGGQRILEAVERKLGISVGESTEDLMFSLDTVSCIGCCGQSPVISVNDEIYGYFKPNMVDDVLHEFVTRS